MMQAKYTNCKILPFMMVYTTCNSNYNTDSQMAAFGTNYYVQLAMENFQEPKKKIDSV